MESIIITYVSKKNGEMDIELFNGANASQVVEELYELDGIEYQWKNEMCDLEYSTDGRIWKKISKKERLVDAGIWDGMYLRLRPRQMAYGHSVPISEENPSEREQPAILSTPRPSFAPEESERPQQPEHKEYVWKLLE
jgi:hypothetical protein